MSKNIHNTEIVVYIILRRNIMYKQNQSEAVLVCKMVRTVAMETESRR